MRRFSPVARSAARDVSALSGFSFLLNKYIYLSTVVWILCGLGRIKIQESEEESDDEDKWDCETILTTKTNVSNHPFKIGKPLSIASRGGAGQPTKIVIGGWVQDVYVFE